MSSTSILRNACVSIRDRRINARKVRRIITELIDVHGAPEHIHSDNGSEFIEKDLHAWLAENQIKTLNIDLGSPWQNGYTESFNTRFLSSLKRNLKKNHQPIQTNESSGSV